MEQLTSNVRGLKIAISGAPGVGKLSLMKQFITSSSFSKCDHDNDDDSRRGRTMSICLDGEESILRFLITSDVMDDVDTLFADAYIVMFAVNDRRSFEDAKAELNYISKYLGDDFPVILVANKIDLARRTLVSSKEARQLAEEFGCKYAETSVELKHQVDDLLHGILHQIKFKENKDNKKPSGGKRLIGYLIKTIHMLSRAR